MIGDEQVRASADMARLIDAVEDVLLEEHQGHVIMPPRVNVMSGGRPPPVDARVPPAKWVLGLQVVSRGPWPKACATSSC